MRLFRGGKLAIMAATVCAFLGFAAAPAQAITIQDLIDDPTATITIGSVEFGGFADLGSEAGYASLFDVNPYQVGNAVGLSFTLNTPTLFTPGNLGLNFSFGGLSLFNPFMDAASFFDGIPSFGDPAAFVDVFSVVIDLDATILAVLDVSADGTNGITSEFPFFGQFPLPANFLIKADIGLLEGQINSLTWVQAFLVPEPGSLALVGVALLGLGLGRRRAKLAAAV